MKPLRHILVLTASTGGGHDARAQAIKEWIFELYKDTVSVRIEKPLEDASLLGKFGVNLYNWIQAHLPILDYVYWFILEIIGQINRRFVFIGRGSFKRLVKEYRPQMIISVHDFLNHGYFEIARNSIGKNNVTCVTYCGEFSGGFGYSWNWVNPSVDLFISRTAIAEAFAQKLGLPKEKSRVFFPLLPPRVVKCNFQENEKETFRSQTLGLHAQKFTLFLATGNNGANHHLKFLDALLMHKQDVQVIAICGQNKKLFETLKHWKHQHPSFPLFLEGYSDQIHKLIQASDAMVAKGGANTASLALYYKCPIIFDNINILMPQERATIRFFLKNQASVIIRSLRDFSQIVSSWKNRGAAFQRIKDKLDCLCPEKESPEQLFHSLLGK